MTTAAPSEASACRRLVLCPSEAPRLLLRNRFLRHHADLPPSAPDFVTAMGVLGYRFALEIRNKQWLSVEFFDLLRAHKIAYALIDQAWMPRPNEIFEKFDPITADFTYIRLLGDRTGIEKQTKIWDKVVVDRSKELMSWINVCQRAVRRGVSTYVYVNNHYAGFAPATVEQFEKL
jgi:uncharacterized protein YecE (DUF72 family)